MTRGIAAALLLFAVAACGGEGRTSANRQTTSDAADKRDLALLTALPIAFAEGFSLESPPHPAMAALQSHFSVRLVDGPEQLEEGGLLLAAQPQALTAERLVALDAWVRRGGRVVLLADPLLEWNSERPLGDPLRPPIAFADTGLLSHWGLTLFAPDEQGPQVRTLADRPVLTVSPGLLAATSRSCRTNDDGFVARCRIGKGRAIVIADSDFLNLAGEGAIDGPAAENLPTLLVTLNEQ